MISNEKDAVRDEIVSAVIAEVEAAGPDRGLRGSQVGMIARRVDKFFSALDYGVPTLKEFINQHAPGLRMIGASGLDPIYGRAEWSDISAPAQVRKDEDPWRTWVSPASPYTLRVDRKTGSVRASPKMQPSGTDEASLEPAGTAVHREIARDFLDHAALDGDARAALGEVLDGEEAEWWPKWSATIRTKFPALAPIWTRHRVDALRRKLRERLEELALPPEVVDAAVTAVCGSRHPQRRPKLPVQIAGAESRPNVERRSVADNEPTASLVELVRSVVGNMSERELRQLWLPVGPLVDALARRSR